MAKRREPIDDLIDALVRMRRRARKTELDRRRGDPVRAEKRSAVRGGIQYYGGTCLRCRRIEVVKNP